MKMERQAWLQLIRFAGETISKQEPTRKTDVWGTRLVADPTGEGDPDPKICHQIHLAGFLHCGSVFLM
jgi:hypothetical protein